VVRTAVSPIEELKLLSGDLDVACAFNVRTAVSPIEELKQEGELEVYAKEPSEQRLVRLRN